MKSLSSGVIAIVGALVIGAVGFFVGAHVGPRFGMGANWGPRPMMNGSKMGNMMRGRGFGGYRGMGMGRMGGAGQITKINGNTISLRYPNGVTQDITISSSTVVDTVVKGAISDLKVGQNVTVGNGGVANGTQTIVVRPQ